MGNSGCPRRNTPHIIATRYPELIQIEIAQLQMYTLATLKSLISHEDRIAIRRDPKIRHSNFRGNWSRASRKLVVKTPSALVIASSSINCINKVSQNMSKVRGCESVISADAYRLLQHIQSCSVSRDDDCDRG